ncbi:MAG TPA: type II CAAX endopeptidase family protein [Bacteroidales bacterium]|nr:type II CAAX endopeptidase family protein [Bacteroidales bacterium]
MEQLPTNVKRQVIVAGILLSFFSLFTVALLVAPLLRLIGIYDITLQFVLYRLCIILCLYIMMVYSVKVEKQKFLLWKENTYSLIYYFVNIVGTMLVLYAGSAIIGVILQLCGLFHDSKRYLETVQILHEHKVLIVIVPLIAGVVEELIFRGYIQARLQLFFKKALMPIFISSVMFGIMHMGYGTVAQIIVPWFIGVVTAVHYYKYRNIKILIICHFLYDFIALYAKSR